MITEWTPEAWAAYCSANPARKIKAERDRRLVSEMLDHLRGNRILEAGCGYGRITSLLSAEDSLLVVMDREPRMVHSVCQAIEKRLRGVAADIEHLPFREKVFDAVICVGVLMHLSHPLEALHQLAKVVKPGGRLLVSWNNRWSPWSLLITLWALRPGALPQRFLGTRVVCRALHRLGFSLQAFRGDALIPLTAALPWTNRSLWPLSLARWASQLDRWVWGRWLLKHQGYELFISADRKGYPPSEFLE